MPDHRESTILLGDEAATDRLGATLAAGLGVGDAVLLTGPVGAGKTHLARATIRALQRAAGLPPEEVPSPTFTLVQTYAAGAIEIWHVDLYRLAGPGDVAELGLLDAFDAALCLVEWPDRLGADRPADAVEVDLAPAADGAGRSARLRLPARHAGLLGGWAA